MEFRFCAPHPKLTHLSRDYVRHSHHFLAGGFSHCSATRRLTVL
ncbi:hypothetical protein BIW11_02461 [Tropilaelaps mercedesae]|uniref:Uncharacterized protein n=1 Tax=Tropilaelaps mercedesae TaxID=418985 RepID=A0A1V9Y2P6_9ACAR|nr:hypothetical protein BIW11_02461 [Tropilaelaps mercedesae]